MIWNCMIVICCSLFAIHCGAKVKQSTNDEVSIPMTPEDEMGLEDSVTDAGPSSNTKTLR